MVSDPRMIVVTIPNIGLQTERALGWIRTNLITRTRALGNLYSHTNFHVPKNQKIHKQRSSYNRNRTDIYPLGLLYH